MRRLLVLGLILPALGLSGDGPPRLAFWHPPAFVGEGFRVPFQLRIPPHDDNRRLDLTAVDRRDDTEVSRTERDLDGRSPALLTVELLLPHGDLQLIAALMGANHQLIARATTPVRVLSPREAPDDPPAWDDPAEP